MSDNFYGKSIGDTLDTLDTSEDGLSTSEVQKRQEQYGLNELEEGDRTTILDIFISQFNDILIWILIFAAILSGITQEWKEAILIVIILILNSTFGVYQEWKADRAIEALKDMTTFDCRVIRDGELTLVQSQEVVPGDIINIEQGDRIPADARLISSRDLRVQEATLTGESTDVAKQADTVFDEKKPLADRNNMVYLGTFATLGKARAVVTHTGMETEMGQIAETVQSLEEGKTPFQLKIEEFGQNLGYGILFLSGLIIVIGTWVRGKQLLEMVKIGISLAVAAIPEGLPIIITLVLALGVQTMAKKNAIIKKLPVVESLGSTTVIATDKTGTLTRNQQTVVESIYFEGPDTITIQEDDTLDDHQFDRVEQLYRSAVLCNNSNIDDDNSYGDPTEQALLNEAKVKGYDIKSMRSDADRLDEIPFDSSRKRMNILVQYEDQVNAYMKGAPDVLLSICEYVDLGHGKTELTDELRQEMLNKMESMASQALRVLAFAYLPAQQDTDLDEIESEMIFLGLMGMIDPAKDGVKEAISACRTAGIRVVMATGDHKTTASAIGRDVGMEIGEGSVMTGQELDTISDEELEKRVQDVNVFARISPSHKLRIMNALKANSEIVAMTGDGVNDAPAIKGADIGISMGIQGTDVTKETADMILADDNFASIVNAVEEGRAIFDNMARFIRYMLSSNLAEILVVFLGLMFQWPIPLVAVQILFINLITDGLPALAMSAEPHEEGIMERPPRDSDSALLNKHNSYYIIRIAIYITTATLFMYWFAGFGTPESDLTIRARTVAFTTLVICQLFNAFNLRHPEQSVLNASFFGNKPLLYTFIGSIILQGLLIHGDQLMQLLVGSGWGNPIGESFTIVPLEPMMWVYIIVISFGTILYEEIFKYIIRRRNLAEDLREPVEILDSLD